MRRPERARGSARRALLAVLATASLAAGPAAAEPALRPEPAPEGDYIESFTFVADLDDGTYVQVQLGVTNLGPDSRNGFCRALVRRPGAEAWSRAGRYGRRWSHTATGPGAERLEVGPCAVASGVAGTFVRAALGDRVVELDLERPLDPPAAPALDLALDGRRYRSWISRPPGPASVRLAGFGVEGSLAGGGFADHSRSNVPYRKLARSWVRFRALRGDRKVLVLARQGLDGTWGPAWTRRGDAPPSPLRGVQVVRSAGGAPGFQVVLAGDAAGIVTGEELIHRFASLSELGLLGRMVAPIVGNSVTYTQRARLAPPGEPPIEGILEVSVFEE